MHTWAHRNWGNLLQPNVKLTAKLLYLRSKDRHILQVQNESSSNSLTNTSLIPSMYELFVNRIERVCLLGQHLTSTNLVLGDAWMIKKSKFPLQRAANKKPQILTLSLLTVLQIYC